MRRVLGPGGPALVASRERVGLAPAVWVDAAAFTELARAGKVDEAVELYRGDLLAGVEDDWVHDVREAHRRQLSDMLETLAARTEKAGDLPPAVALSRRRAELDPLDEGAHACLIARLAAAGNTVEALVCYEKHRDALRRELGVAPSPATREFALALRAAPPPAALPAARAAPRRPARPEPSWAPGERFPLPPRLRLRQAAPFVGRAEELAELHAAWRDTCTGSGPLLVVVAGEAGIGKSRLARELAMQVRPTPAVVLQGTAQEDAIAALQPFVEAIGHVLRVAPGELSRLLGAHAHHLAPLLPELPAGPPEPGDDLSVRRYRMLDAVAELLAALSRSTPVLLILDDLHWADAATSGLVRHVLESRPEARLLVVATCRDDAVPAGGHLGEALRRLHQAHLVRRIRLTASATRTPPSSPPG